MAAKTALSFDGLRNFDYVNADKNSAAGNSTSWSATPPPGFKSLIPQFRANMSGNKQRVPALAMMANAPGTNNPCLLGERVRDLQSRVT